MPLTLESSGDSKIKTIKISGRFDFSTQNEFRDCYHGIPPEDGIEFVIDMDGANYIDSSALGMLLMMREQLGGDSAKISITNCSSEIKNILHVANFQTLFDMS